MPAAAQNTVIERLNIDRLQLVSLGVEAGTIRASQVHPTNVFAIGSDYGEIARGWRVEFGISYWESRYNDEAVREFVDTLKSAIGRPDLELPVDRINVFDVIFDVGFRRNLSPKAFVTPFLAFGAAAHVINVEGRLIKGTFIERALDNIAAGTFVTVGGQARLHRRLLLEVSARGDLLSSYRSVQLRGGGSYVFSTRRTPLDGGSPDE